MKIKAEFQCENFRDFLKGFFSCEAKDLYQALDVNMVSFNRWIHQNTFPVWALWTLGAEIYLNEIHIEKDLDILILLKKEFKLNKTELAEWFGVARSTLVRWNTTQTWPMYVLEAAGMRLEFKGGKSA